MSETVDAYRRPSRNDETFCSLTDPSLDTRHPVDELVSLTSSSAFATSRPSYHFAGYKSFGHQADILRLESAPGSLASIVRQQLSIFLARGNEKPLNGRRRLDRGFAADQSLDVMVAASGSHKM